MNSTQVKPISMQNNPNHLLNEKDFTCLMSLFYVLKRILISYNVVDYLFESNVTPV